MANQVEIDLGKLIYIERIPGCVFEVREKPLPQTEDMLARGHFLFRRLKEQLDGLIGRPHRYKPEVIFADFKASPKPDIEPPDCKACDGRLQWRPHSYSFGDGTGMYKVPEIGWWRCPKGHPGEIYMPDYLHYADLVHAAARRIFNEPKTTRS